MYIGIGFLTLIMIGCIPIVNIFLMGPVLGGFYYVVLRDMRDEPVEFGMMFKGFEKFVPLMLVGLIQAIPGVLIQIVQYTVDIARLAGLGPGESPLNGDFFQSSGTDLAGTGIAITVLGIIFVFLVLMILWTIAFQFAVPLIIEHDIGVGEAIKLSFNAGFANIGGIIVLFILAGLVGLLGLLALCVGYFVAVPVGYAAFAFAYRQVFPSIESRLNYSPPPPTAYGFGGGQ
jgi:uncharacterized membrane protein